MSLDKTFGKQEKVEERALETIATTEAIVDELFLLCKSTTPNEILDGFAGLKECEQYKQKIEQIVKNYKITQGVIKAFTKKLEDNKESKTLLERSPGIFLSALIQTSYNQGFNNFEFEYLIGTHYFGTTLRGEKNRKLMIKADTIGCYNLLWYAEHCHLTVKKINNYDDVNSVLTAASNCVLIAKSIEAASLLVGATDCIVEIEEYKGKLFGNQQMKDCTIYSPNKETIEKLQKQSVALKGNNNNIIHDRMPKEFKEWD